MKQVEVVAGVIDYNGEILCAKRDVGKYAYVSNVYEFPGGKIEAGETYKETLTRELMEEMEMKVEIGEHYCDIVHEYPDFVLTMHVFLCKAHSKDIKLNVHTDCKWLKIEDLKTLNWAPADMPVVEKLQK